MVDATRLARGLYIGSAPKPAEVKRAGFDIVVLCAREYQPATSLFGNVQVLRLPIDDNALEDLTESEQRNACAVSQHVAQAVVHGKRVLVTCLAGRNRSGLVAATALRLLYPKLTAQEIVDHIKQARGMFALSNYRFVKLLTRNYCESL